jgi:hypothetical protein
MFQEDKSERLFEVSAVAEILKSLLALSYANLIVDFLISENPALSYIADLR